MGMPGKLYISELRIFFCIAGSMGQQETRCIRGLCHGGVDVRSFLTKALGNRIWHACDNQAIPTDVENQVFIVQHDHL